jgi:hypothetical protein
MFLEKKSWKTIDELISLIAEALKKISVKTVIIKVRDVLDFKSHYAPHINTHLSRFSYSGARGTPGTDEFTAHKPGYHKLSISRSPLPATPATASFRK